MEGERPKRVAILLVIAVFLLGAAAGGLGTYVLRGRVLASNSNAPHHQQNPRPKMTAENSPALKDLGLSQDQQKQIDALLVQMQSQYGSIHEQWSAQMDAARKQGRDQIRAILTPEQAAKFDDTLRKWDEERKKRNGN
jgi:Spy/CpxP family protein refolding chaperone